MSLLKITKISKFTMRMVEYTQYIFQGHWIKTSILRSRFNRKMKWKFLKKLLNLSSFLRVWRANQKFYHLLSRKKNRKFKKRRSKKNPKNLLHHWYNRLSKIVSNVLWQNSIKNLKNSKRMFGVKMIKNLNNLNTEKSHRWTLVPKNLCHKLKWVFKLKNSI